MIISFEFLTILESREVEFRALYSLLQSTRMSFLAQLVERVTSNDEVSRSSRLEGRIILLGPWYLPFSLGLSDFTIKNVLRTLVVAENSMQYPVLRNWTDSNLYSHLDKLIMDMLWIYYCFLRDFYILLQDPS